MTKEKIYNVFLFVNGGWMVDQRQVRMWFAVGKNCGGLTLDCILILLGVRWVCGGILSQCWCFCKATANFFNLTGIMFFETHLLRNVLYVLALVMSSLWRSQGRTVEIAPVIIFFFFLSSFFSFSFFLRVLSGDLLQDRWADFCK